jgi:hypothetical protein
MEFRCLFADSGIGLASDLDFLRDRYDAERGERGERE